MTVVPETVQTSAPPRRHVVLNVVYSIFARVQSGIFSYLTTCLLLRALKVEEYGFYTVLFIGTTANLGLVARLGLANLLTRFIPEYFTQHNYRMIARLFRASNLLQSGFGVILLVLTFIFASTISGWVKFPNSENIIRVFAVGAFAFLLSENFRILLSGVFLQRTIFVVNLIYNIVRLATIYYVIHLPEPLLAVVVAEGSLFLLSVALYQVAYRRMVRPRVIADTRPEERPPWKRFVRYTGLSYINEVGVMLLNTATDLLLVTGILGGPAVAMYGLACRILTLVQNALPSNFLSVVISPLFFSEYGASRDRARFGFTLLTKISLLVTIPMGVWTAIMARPLITQLFDPRYGDAAPVLGIMALFLPMEALRYPTGLMLQNAERNDLLAWSKLIGVVKIGIGLWLVPIYGVLGMAWIAGGFSTALNAIQYMWIVTVLDSGTDMKGVAKLAINGGISAAVFYPMAHFFTGVVGVFASLIVYPLIYLAISVVHKTFRPEEREFINSKLPKPLWVF
jgi:O-antigen/teichoic acid export membrane protein